MHREDKTSKQVANNSGGRTYLILLCRNLSIEEVSDPVSMEDFREVITGKKF